MMMMLLSYHPSEYHLHHHVEGNHDRNAIEEQRCGVNNNDVDADVVVLLTTGAVSIDTLGGIVD